MTLLSVHVDQTLTLQASGSGVCRLGVGSGYYIFDGPLRKKFLEDQAAGRAAQARRQPQAGGGDVLK